MENKQDILSLQSATNLNTKCEIDLTGGGITNLYLNNKHILYAGPRPDGGKAFTHPCIPNFNIAKNLPNHGPARKETWEKINDNTIVWEMKEIENIYPKGIKATREFKLKEKSITVTTTIENIGSEELTTNIAEHSYFACPKEEVKNVKVNGILFHKEALKANAQFNPWQDKNILEIPSIGKLEFNTKGYKAFAQWSQIDAPFACVEPIEIMPPEPEDFFEIAPKMKPGETKVFEYIIKLK
jgi:galactose mutarotase-like enzyme